MKHTHNKILRKLLLNSNIRYRHHTFMRVNLVVLSPQKCLLPRIKSVECSYGSMIVLVKVNSYLSKFGEILDCLINF